uniref:Uncharacterized protein n=1 Tax=Salmonella phage vB_SEnST11_KE23 TaxID=3161174 RepID=A0AAU8GGC8_9CAUD
MREKRTGFNPRSGTARRANRADSLRWLKRFSFKKLLDNEFLNVYYAHSILRKGELNV